MHEPPRSPTRPPFRLPTLALFSVGLLAVGGEAAAPPAPDEAVPSRSRVPARTTEPAARDADEPAALLPADLAAAAKHAPPPVAALYGSLAEANAAATPPYEETALKKVVEFLNGPGAALPAPQRLWAAETVLAAALRFHFAERDPPLGRGSPSPLEADLRATLRAVRLELLHATARAARREADWAAALELAERWLRTYPAAVPAAARVRIAYAGFRLLHDDPAGARRQVEWVEEHFPPERTFTPLRVTWLYRPSLESIRRSLHDRAALLVHQAVELSDTRAALRKLEQALDAWPRLPGLRDAYLRRKNAYTVLYVGVRALPERLSPATACTDAERQGVELLFEGLLQATQDDRGELFRPQLAARPPAITPGGRRFDLHRTAAWSNGTPVTARDVRDTVELLASPRLQGRTPEWTDLLEKPSEDGERSRIEFKFRQSYFDPLGPLTFKILPGFLNLPQADDDAFAHRPIGSGPYQYAGRQVEEDGRACAVFTANPHYRRPAHPDGPGIREIRFYVPTNPARDLRDPKRPLHLLLNLPTARLRELEKAGFKEVRTVPNRRVYFLALNHRVAALGNIDLRRAFAHALDRNQILNYWFRGGDPAHHVLPVVGGPAALATLDMCGDVRAEFHRPLNSPYPPDSWACDSAKTMPADLYDLRKAGTFAGAARKVVPAVDLTLKYPADEPGVADACRDVAAQLTRLGTSLGWKVQITPVPVPPRQLREDLRQHRYELAYHHLDYATEAYWLWPLFDSRREAVTPGGANFLGYEDAILEGYFRTAMNQRDFDKVRNQTHKIHAHLVDRMPLIPLWQLDTHVAVHPSLRTAAFDPLLVFDRVEDWKLEQ